jgi:hypothetical protein
MTIAVSRAVSSDKIRSSVPADNGWATQRVSTASRRSRRPPDENRTAPGRRGPNLSNTARCSLSGPVRAYDNGGRRPRGIGAAPAAIRSRANASRPPVNGTVPRGRHAKARPAAARVGNLRAAAPIKCGAGSAAKRTARRTPPSRRVVSNAHAFGDLPAFALGGMAISSGTRQVKPRPQTPRGICRSTSHRRSPRAAPPLSLLAHDRWPARVCLQLRPPFQPASMVCARRRRRVSVSRRGPFVGVGDGRSKAPPRPIIIGGIERAMRSPSIDRSRLRRPALQSSAQQRAVPARQQPRRRRRRRVGQVRKLRRLRRLHPRLAFRLPPRAEAIRFALGDRQLSQHLPRRRDPAGSRLLGAQRRGLAQGQSHAEFSRPALHQRA